MSAVLVPIRLPLASGEPTAAAPNGVPVLSPIRLKLMSNGMLESNCKSGLVLLKFPAMIELVMDSDGLAAESTTKTPPPSPEALLRVIVTLLSVMSPEDVEMPPPSAPRMALLPLTVLLANEIEAVLVWIPPPLESLPLVSFPLMVLLLIATEPASLKMAPPLSETRLPAIVERSITKSAAAFLIAPPSLLTPPVITSPPNATTSPAAAVMLNTRELSSSRKSSLFA